MALQFLSLSLFPFVSVLFAFSFHFFFLLLFIPFIEVEIIIFAQAKNKTRKSYVNIQIHISISLLLCNAYYFINKSRFYTCLLEHQFSIRQMQGECHCAVCCFCCMENKIGNFELQLKNKEIENNNSAIESILLSNQYYDVSLFFAWNFPNIVDI